MQPYFANVHVAGFLTRERTKPCPTCGKPAKKTAVFDADEVYLNGYCEDEHTEVTYAWPTSRSFLHPSEARALGFRIIVA